MSFKKLGIGAFTLALAVASAASSYKVTLTQPTWVGSTQLKAGDYKVEVSGSNVVFKSGKDEAQASATVEKTLKKNAYTAVETSADSKLQSILLGGTDEKIVIKSVPVDRAPAGGSE